MAKQLRDPGTRGERAVYGFALYFGTILLFGVFYAWALIPDSVLNAIGITYYPQKYWSVALFVYILVGFVFFLFVYNFMNLMKMPPLNSVNTVEDEHTHYQSTDEEVCPDDIRAGSLPKLRDIPLSKVCEMLYLDDSG
jgi:phosphatidylinositol glycan class P protein